MESKVNEEKERCYRCTHCGYIYEPKRGCEKNKVKPDTPFNETPEDYRCPVCKAKKSGFYPIK